MGRRILLVEGDDDMHVVYNLRDVHSIAKSAFDVKKPTDAEASGLIASAEEGGGDTKLLDSLRWRLAASDLDRLAVVIDANGNGPQSRWASIRDRLRSAGFQGVPDQHDPNGTVFDLSLRNQTPRSVRFGAWIMPDNRSQGMLEDFTIRLVREDHALLPLVDRFVDSVPESRHRYRNAHRAKARIHTCLAVSDPPGRPMGQAIGMGLLDGTRPSVALFIAWIRRALVD